MLSRATISPCLWFDDQAEQAANLYVSIFPNSKITRISRYGKEGFEIHGKPAGSVLTVAYELDGQPFTALNGGPMFKFNEAISLQVFCRDQQEIDHYWYRLSDGGDKNAQRCGWLKDRFGVSWQVVPAELGAMLSGGDAARAGRVMSAIFQMGKLDLATIQRAYDG